MAYNSDGYIMIDFKDVDFRRTNQTVDGLYKRCVDVIGTNKFILVINANGRTPMPATCSYVNNQYVIDSFIYLFSITSDDNIFIRRNDIPASDIIDDSVISVDKTWSSDKINTELDGKADTSALADYQPLLTAGAGISIVNDIISLQGVKSFTYVGNGGGNKIIDIPQDCTLIISIYGENLDYLNFNCSRTGSIILIDGISNIVHGMLGNTDSDSVSQIGCRYSYNGTNRELTLTAGTSLWNSNYPNTNYTVYYI